MAKFRKGTTLGEATWLVAVGMRAVAANAGLYLKAPGIAGSMPSVDHAAMVRDAAEVGIRMQAEAFCRMEETDKQDREVYEQGLEQTGG
jgi:hypothetical protein